MEKEKHIVLIPGTWSRSSYWDSLPERLEGLGLRVHTPEKRYHDLSYEEIEKRIGDLSLNAYVSDYLEYARGLEGDVLVLGHSLGGLIAQRVDEDLDLKGLILLGTAPSSDIFALYPAMVHSFYKHFLRWGFWKKPMPPYKNTYYKYVTNKQTLAYKENGFKDMVPESGRVYFQISMPFLDKEKAATVENSKITCPVLIITSENDRIVHPNIARQTAKNYDKSKLVVLKDSDHLYMSDRSIDWTMHEIRAWMDERGI